MCKGKKRPIGYTSPGGFVKTTKGWRKRRSSTVGSIKTKGSTTAKKDTLSKKTKAWLDKWAWYLDTKKEYIIRDVPSEVVKELRKYRPTKPIKVYRGIKAGKEKTEKLKKLKSYTHEKGLAEAIASTGDFVESGLAEGKVEERIVQPGEVIVDFTLLPKKYKEDFIDEVLIKERK